MIYGYEPEKDTVIVRDGQSQVTMSYIELSNMFADITRLRKKTEDEQGREVANE